MSSVESYRKPANIWDLKPRRKREDRADSSASDRTQSVEVDNTTSRSDKLPRDSSGSRLKDIAGTWLVEKEEEEEEEESLNNAPESSRTAPTAQTSPRRHSELPISPARKEPVTRAAKRKPSSNLQTESPKRVVTVPADESSDADSDAPMFNRVARRASQAMATSVTASVTTSRPLRQDTIDLTESADDDDSSEASDYKPTGGGSGSRNRGQTHRTSSSKEFGETNATSSSREVKSEPRGQSVDKEVVLDSIFSMKPKKRPQPVGGNGSSSSAQPRRRNQDSASASSKRRRGSPSPDHNLYAKKKTQRSKLTYESTEQFTRRRSESPVEETKLTRQQIIDLENAAHKVSTGYRAFRDGTITDRQLWSMRTTLHRIPFLIVNALHRNIVTDVLKQVRRDGRDLQIPSDIVLDAEYILNRWLHNDDFDPDLLRGINKTKRVAQRLDAAGQPRGGKKTITSSSLEDGYRWRKNARIRGHNGLVIGQWWPLQICCLRDGAHGVIEGGISADSDGIAVSIIISGGTKSPNLTYEDEDLLHTIHYCGTRGDKASTGGPGIPSNATKSMIRALETRKEVRVIRSFKSREKGAQNYAPAEGFRYDGLYRVTAKECLDVEHAMWRFRLERWAGQPEVRWQGEGVKPTSEERHRWGDVKDLWKNVV